ncbi:MAG: alpha-2-macroglobulin family protein [Pseudomonadota bacterium]
MLRVVLALALSLFTGGALAQEGPTPDRRIVTTTGQDFYGADIGSIFETDFRTCRQACLGNPACMALTYNTRAEACFLKSGIERREPFADAISAEMILTPAATAELARQRRADMPFISDSLIERARLLAATLGGRFAANAQDPADLMRVGARAESQGNYAGAARNYAPAVSVTDSADGWRDLARAWLNDDSGNRQARIQRRGDALSAAINAYLRSDVDGARVTSLAVMAEVLENRGYGRAMIDALKLAQGIQPRAETAERLEYAISRYGFRVTGHRVDSDAAIARICIDFSEPLAEAGLDYSPYIKVQGDDTLPVEAEGNQLCIDGVARGERYQVTVRDGLPSADGEELFSAARIEAYIRDRSPSVHFVGKAHVLPRSADAAMPVVSVNVQEVELAIHRIGERNLLPAMQDNLLDQQLNAWREERIAEGLGAPVWTGTAEVSGAVNADVTTALPIGEAISDFQPGIYVMTARVAGTTDRWERAATQWFIVTDLGLASMTGADGLHGFVRALSSAEAVAGATVNLVARNNEVLGSATADAAGYVRFDAGLARGTGGMAPAMLTVETADDFAFLDLTAPGFDLSDRGVEGRAAPGPVDVFATTERGVYRPGEVVHLTALARDGRAAAIDNLPLTAIFTRPDGVEYHRALLADQGAAGRAYSLRLGSGVPRGTWKLNLHTDPKAAPVAQVSFLVEDFVPERIDFDLDMAEGLVQRDAEISLSTNVRYLYGAPAGDLTVGGEVRVTAADGLPGFPGFKFGLHGERVDPMSEYLSEVATDANGDATIRLSLPDSSGLTRPLQMTAIIGVTDSSGRPVERRVTRPLAPGSTQIGIRPLFDGQVEEGGNARFEALAVGADGQQIALDRVGWTLSRINRDWQWYRVDGRWRYEAISTRTRVANGIVALTADGRAQIEAPVEWGEYELRLASLGNQPIMATTAFYAGWYTGGAGTDTPDVLEVGLDKERYAIGETVRLRLKPRDEGKVLVAVVDNRLIEMQTVDVQPGETSVDLTVSEDWGPGAYITATLIRPMDVAAKRNPARALGLAWATVDPGDRALNVAFSTPDEVAPRGPLTAGIQIANLAPGEQAFVTIAAVDLGILNLTSFDSPDPAGHYFGQRALGMEMRDLYGKLIDGMQGVRGRLRSGGDAAAARLDAPPPTEELVAYFSGVVTVGPDGRAEARFELPDFNGTVRLMAVAWTSSGVGSAEKDVLVRDPIVVSTAVPRFLAPGDQARVLIEVAHATGPTGDMGVALENVDGGIQFDPADATRQITLQEGQIQRISVPITAAEIGDPKLRVRTTTPDGTVLTKTLTMPVRLNDPEVSRRNRLTLAANGGRLIVDRGTFAGLQPGTARASLALGPVAQFDAAGLLVALDRYPYGCTEQTTSRALPLLYLDQVAGAMGITRDNPVNQRVQEAIARVLENQSSSGAFGLWRPNRGDLWLDAYVTDFLSRAKAQGYEVPQVAFDSALDNLASELSYVSDFEQGGEDIAYALMVLARQGRASIGDLRYYADARADRLATPMAKAQLGAALAMYGEQRRADAMFRLAADQALSPPPGELGWRADYGSHLRDGAAVLALAAEAGSDAVDVSRLANAVSSRIGRWTSTQEKVWMLLATRALMDRATEGLTVNGQPVDGPLVRVFDDRMGDQVVIENQGSTETLAMLTTFGVPSDPEPAGGTGYAIERTYYSLEGDPVSPETVAQNARLAVVLTVRASAERRGRLMIDDPLPAGFEIDNPNLLQAGSIRALDWLETTADVESAQFRSDRFLTAVNFNGRGELRVAYIVRAVSPGSFHHPAALVEDMYRPEFRAWTGTGRVDVVAGR